MLKGSKKGKIFRLFKPTLELQEAFWRLQSKFTKMPVLAHFNYKKSIHLVTNTSAFAIAGITLQPAARPTSGKE
jgi:hypothetical protein